MAWSHRFSAFIRDESGAASIDWVVLAAACVTMGLGVTNVVATEMSNLTQEVRAELQRDMRMNPFDLEHSSLGTNGCVHLYIDPAADPAASYDPSIVHGCNLAASLNDDDADDATESSTFFITDEDV